MKFKKAQKAAVALTELPTKGKKLSSGNKLLSANRISVKSGTKENRVLGPILSLSKKIKSAFAKNVSKSGDSKLTVPKW